MVWNVGHRTPPGNEILFHRELQKPQYSFCNVRCHFGLPLFLQMGASLLVWTLGFQPLRQRLAAVVHGVHDSRSAGCCAGPMVWVRAPVRAHPNSSSLVILTPPLVARWARVFGVSHSRNSTRVVRRPKCDGAALLLEPRMLAMFATTKPVDTRGCRGRPARRSGGGERQQAGGNRQQGRYRERWHQLMPVA